METTVIAVAVSSIVTTIALTALRSYFSQDRVKARLWRLMTQGATKLVEMESQSPDAIADAARDAAKLAEQKKQFQVAVEKLVA